MAAMATMARRSTLLLIAGAVFLLIRLLAALSFIVELGHSNISRGITSPTAVVRPQPVISGKAALDYGSNEKAARSDELLRWIVERRNETLNGQVRSVKLNGYGSLTNWTLLSQALESISHLEELHWNHQSAPPVQILSALESAHPPCKLFWDINFRWWDPGLDYEWWEQRRYESEEDIARRAVSGAKNLYQLRAHIEYSGEPNTKDLHLVQLLLQTSPNIKELDLSIRHGCCLLDWPQARAFDFSSGGEFGNLPFPALKSLKLSGYNLDNRVDGSGVGDRWKYKQELKWPLNHLPQRVISFVGYDTWERWHTIASKAVITERIASRNLDAWLGKMDWSHLETLELNSPTSNDLMKLAPVLSHLQHLKIFTAGQETADTVPSFLSILSQPLSSLSLEDVYFNSFSSLLNILISKHSPSLTSFTLRESESLRQHGCWQELYRDDPRCQEEGAVRSSCYFTEPHLYLNSTQISLLHDLLSHLSNLDLDIDRASPTNHTLHHISTSFPNLQSLTLRFESVDSPAARSRNESISDHDAYYGHSPGSSIISAIEDPFVTKELVNRTFHLLRSSHPRQYQQRQGNCSSGSPSNFRTLQIILGEFDLYRDWNSMVSPNTGIVLGRWRCSCESASPSSSSFSSSSSPTSLLAPPPLDEPSADRCVARCKGGYTLPDIPWGLDLVPYMPEGSDWHGAEAEAEAELEWLDRKDREASAMKLQDVQEPGHRHGLEEKQGIRRSLPGC